MIFVNTESYFKQNFKLFCLVFYVHQKLELMENSSVFM